MKADLIKLYHGLVVELRYVLLSDGFRERHRRDARCFVRTRCLTFVTVILILLNMLKRSLQDELDEFFHALERGEVAERLVSKGAFSQARKKFKHTAFIELNTIQVSYFYQRFDVELWKEMRLLSIDGSMAQLPNRDAIAEHFGVWHPHAGGECPKARLSQLFDVLNKVTLDALIMPKSCDERDLATRHFEQLRPNDLLLLDRGYPAFWFFRAIQAQQAYFCARLSTR